MSQDTPEYRAILKATDKLTKVLTNNITSICAELIANDLITPEQQKKIINHDAMERAADLVQLLTDKVKENTANYYILVKILEEDRDMYEDVLTFLKWVLEDDSAYSSIPSSEGPAQYQDYLVETSPSPDFLYFSDSELIAEAAEDKEAKSELVVSTIAKKEVGDKEAQENRLLCISTTTRKGKENSELVVSATAEAAEDKEAKSELVVSTIAKKEVADKEAQENRLLVINPSKYCLINVPNNCNNMKKLTQMVIPKFDPVSGNGYVEFCEPQLIQKDQKFLLMDKDGRLFAGHGIHNFVYDNQEGTYISPPKLSGTEWKHVFVQSTSIDTIISSPLFLYFNPQTDVSSHHLLKEESKQLTTHYRFLLLTPNVVSISYEKDDNGRHIFRIGVIETPDAKELPDIIIYETLNNWVKIPVCVIEEGEIIAFSGPYQGGCSICTEGLDEIGSLGINIVYNGHYRLISAAHVLTQHRTENIGKEIFKFENNQRFPMNVKVEGHKEVVLYEYEVLPTLAVSDLIMSKRDIAWARIDETEGLPSIQMIGVVQSIRLPIVDETVQFYGGASLRLYKSIKVKSIESECKVRVKNVKFSDEIKKDCVVFFDDTVRLEFVRELIPTDDVDVGFPDDIMEGDSGSAVVASDNCVVAILVSGLRSKTSRSADGKHLISTCELYASKLLD